MTYLDDLAAEIERKVPPRLLPEHDSRPLFRLYALLALAKGPAVNATDVHNAWAAWTQERDSGHPLIRPFDELDAETQSRDKPFVEAIRSAMSTASHEDGDVRRARDRPRKAEWPCFPGPRTDAQAGPSPPA